MIEAVFGQAVPDSITSPVIQMYMDARGQQYPTAANRERTFLSIIFRWGKARGLVSIEDPARAVKPIKEKPIKEKPIKEKQAGRYVEDSEYLAFYNWLEPKGHTAHAAAMEIAHLCAARQQDVLALKRQDITDEGLLICQQKTGKKQLKLWTDRLHDAVELALKSNTTSRSQSMYLIRGRTGQHFTRDRFNTTWSRE
ncbi:hypothetical protein ACJJI3_02305 [Microbulbifer sp. ZKSA004]|uniref:hypothetical protein n=1 Tax=Microbulbifer sp. ZKSA004 TaxID=3243389 RepID=UPI004039EBC5